jgi:hypothetical protein
MKFGCRIEKWCFFFQTPASQSIQRHLLSTTTAPTYPTRFRSLTSYLRRPSGPSQGFMTLQDLVVLSYKLLAKQRTATVRQRLGQAKTRWGLRASRNYMLSHSRYYTGFAIMVVALYLTSICSQLTTMAPTTPPRPQYQHLLAYACLTQANLGMRCL